jgi:hypothetical protein
MNTSALTQMLITQVTVTCVTIYFFLKILKTPVSKDADQEDESAS